MSVVVRFTDGSTSVNVAQGQYVLDALLEAGIEHPYSCRQGFCTTCRVRVISGCIEEDPNEECALSRRQLDDGLRLICVGFAKTDSVIEIA